MAGVFQELRSATGGNGFSPSPISWSEIDAYCRLRRVKLNDWALSLIRLADGEFLAWAIAESKKPQ